MSTPIDNVTYALRRKVENVTRVSTDRAIALDVYRLVFNGMDAAVDGKVVTGISTAIVANAVRDAIWEELR